MLSELIHTGLRRAGYLLLFLSLEAGSASAQNIYRVGSVVPAREKNTILDIWIDRDFSIWVGIEREQPFIFFRADTGLGEALVQIPYEEQIRADLVSAVLKAIEWSEVARTNRTDTIQPLTCFSNDSFYSNRFPRADLCKEDGTAYKKGQVGLSFFAARKGQQTNIIVSIIDASNDFLEATLYLQPDAMRILLDNANAISATFEKARDTASKQDLFQ